MYGEQNLFIRFLIGVAVATIILEWNPVGSFVLSPLPLSCGSDRVYFPQTRRCYHAYTKGPCGELMVLTPSAKNKNIGECRCAVSSHPDEDSTCPSRPKVYWKDASRCFYIFDQGPCKDDEWLVVSEENSPKCDKIPCLEEYKNQTKQEDYSVGDNKFIFAHEGKCYTTHTEGQLHCKPYEEVYFSDNSFTPKCSGYFTCSVGGLPRRHDSKCPDGSAPDIHGGCGASFN